MTVNRVTCRRDVGYTSAGRTYEVEREKGQVYFHSVETGGSTSMPVWEFNAAMKSGAMVEADYRCTGPSVVAEHVADMAACGVVV